MGNGIFLNKDNKQIGILTMFLVLLFYFSVTTYASDIEEKSLDDDCLKCHQKTWESAFKKQYVHKPFLEKKCKLCHIQNTELVNNSREFMKDNSIKWLARRRITTKTHWFTVPVDDINDHVHIDCQIPGQGTIRNEIVLPSKEELIVLEDDNIPPEISEIRVKDMTRGLFLTATIGWHTDELGTSQLYYGRKKLNNKSEHSDNFTKEHTVQLAGLKFKKKYKFKIVSEDIFGNKTESKEYSFSTAKAKRKKQANPTKLVNKELRIKHSVYRIGEDYLFKIAANRPVIMALGTPKQIDEVEEDLQAEGILPPGHNLKDALVTNNSVCEPCHGKYTKDRNHPVNVPAQNGMRIPEDYFVLSNGNMTCMTCHSAHSSDFEYRLIRSSKRELCIGCHLDRI